MSYTYLVAVTDSDESLEVLADEYYINTDGFLIFYTHEFTAGVYKAQSKRMTTVLPPGAWWLVQELDDDDDAYTV